MLDVLEPWLRSADLVEQVRDIARLAATRAGDLDQDGSFPTEDIHALAAIGALKAPMPPAYGGLGLGTTPEGAPALLDVLRWIGHGSLPLGRLYEGHVNALALVARFGTASQVEEAARISLASTSRTRPISGWSDEPPAELHPRALFR